MLRSGIKLRGKNVLEIYLPLFVYVIFVVGNQQVNKDKITIIFPIIRIKMKQNNIQNEKTY